MNEDTGTSITYHPDPEINERIRQEALASEVFDLSVGYRPRAWTCTCGQMHERGHFGAIGAHRCLACGYVGTAGVMHGSAPGKIRITHDYFAKTAIRKDNES